MQLPELVAPRTAGRVANHSGPWSSFTNRMLEISTDCTPPGGASHSCGAPPVLWTRVPRPKLTWTTHLPTLPTTQLALASGCGWPAWRAVQQPSWTTSDATPASTRSPSGSRPSTSKALCLVDGHQSAGHTVSAAPWPCEVPDNCRGLDGSRQRHLSNSGARPHPDATLGGSSPAPKRQHCPALRYGARPATEEPSPRPRRRWRTLAPPDALNERVIVPG